MLGETDAIVGLDLGGMLSVNADARADATLPPLQSVPEPDFTLSGLLVMLPIQL
ncbi:MAG: hypothetical protein JO235_03600 [Chroococcidiopsidaceae cyanobacterium CP_BM_RX_35]|nr:hypothetical protein [Chroococcidiopsidaceae cyanobacterium CP_BM_RX_35]